MDRVRVIEGSLRCFACGWLSLLPLVGPAAAFVSIAEYYFVKRIAQGGWNPAGRHLRSGLFLAIAGLLLNAIPCLLISVWMLAKIADGSIPPMNLFP